MGVDAGPCSLGMAASSSRVYGCWGRARTSSAGADLDDAAEVHDRDVVRHVAHDGEVVGDEQHRQAAARRCSSPDQVEHGALDRDVERRGDLVGDEHLGAAGERAGHGDALPLATRELRRVRSRPRRVEVDEFEQPRDLGARSARRSARGSASAMDAPIVMRGSSDEYGSWKTICRGAPAGSAAAAARRAGCGRCVDGREPDGGPGERRLAGSRLADEPDDLAGGHREARPVDGGRGRAGRLP